MAVREILLLGNPALNVPCAAVARDEAESLRSVVADMHDTLMDFRRRWGAGRAIAAPQIGVGKRLIYLHIDSPVVLVNPRLENLSTEMFELWDDCFSFPHLLVKVRRHRSCRVVFRDLEWQEHSIMAHDALSELLQHECDHLDGILAVERAIDGRSFAYRSERTFLEP
ncbi:MAG: peptide deformylase [candidate division Zixibacteria bacterium]|nr:peptide deformylase [candidate division Zixibacteria bacterium]